MSYEKDKKKFERRYGKEAVANSIKATEFFLEKVRKQDKWILHFRHIGKIKWFNDGVKNLCAMEIADGYHPDINLVITKRELKQLRDIAEKVIGMGDELKALKTAKLCFKRAVKEKDKKRYNSLMYQFCLQMKRYCAITAKGSKNPEIKRILLADAKAFGAFAKIYRGMG